MSATYIFAGNRSFAFEELLKSSLKLLRIFAVKGSQLERFLKAHHLSYEILPPKAAFVEILKSTNFNLFIANGLPIILPVSEIIGQSEKKMINIHPSFLPDLRGADPLSGAMLFGRNSGATCHYMDDGIDTGTIIAQELIPYCESLDAKLLYQLSFMAEKKVIRKSLERNFKPLMSQKPVGHEIYYTFKDKDLHINFMEPVEKILRRIKAFNIRSKGAFFTFKDEKYRVMDVELVENEYIEKLFTHANDGEVIFNYENKLLLKINDAFIKLKQIDKDISHIKAGYNFKS